MGHSSISQSDNLFVRKMKKLGIIVVVLLISQGIYAQKWGYIDAAYILQMMPEYDEVQQELDKVSQQWQEEIASMRLEVQSLYDAYQAEEVLLTDEMKEERMAAIKEKEETGQVFHRKMFGYEGLFFLKKKELSADVTELEQKIDVKVAELYGISTSSASSTTSSSRTPKKVKPKGK